MQLFILLIFSAFALAASSNSASPSTCIVGNQCSQPGYSCTPTSSCGGLCLTSQTFPPVIPCTIGNNGPCPTGSTCTPTEYCTAGSTAPCGGQCITTSPPPPNTSNLPTIPCEVGASSSCPTNAFCTPTEVCSGVCRTAPITGSTPTRSTSPSASTSTSHNFTPSSPPFTPTTTVPPLPSCTIGGDASCSSGSICTPLVNCYGFCHSGISSPTILPPATTAPPPPDTTALNACIVGRPANDNGCPTNSYCLPTQTCAGLCLNTVIPPPPTTTTFPTTQTLPTIPYTTISGTPYATCIWEQPGLYASPPCPNPGSSCSPTPSCGGQCFTTAPGITTTCTVGGSCAANAGGGKCQPFIATCNTAGCPGMCPTTACSISGNQCPTEAICSQTEYCYGICIPSSPATLTGTVVTPSSSLQLTSTATLSSPTPSGTCGWVYIPCGNGYKCVNSKGKECGLGDSGHCVPDRQEKKRRFLAGGGLQ